MVDSVEDDVVKVVSDSVVPVELVLMEVTSPDEVVKMLFSGLLGPWGFPGMSGFPGLLGAAKLVLLAEAGSDVLLSSPGITILLLPGALMVPLAVSAGGEMLAGEETEAEDADGVESGVGDEGGGGGGGGSRGHGPGAVI
tara:strand:- start:7210 stop:7629 length:420 start_codon:yes stop_codon:yes gene_type:complete